MAQLGKIDLLIQESDGDAIASVTTTVRKQGASVNGAQSGTSPLTVTVDHVGALTSGAETVDINGAGSTYSCVIASETTVTLSGFAGTLVLADDDRISPTGNLPSIYNDRAGTEALSNPLAVTGPDGQREAWALCEPYDILFTGGTLAANVLRRDVPATGGDEYRSHVYTSATAVGWIWDTLRSLTTAGAKLLSLKNASVEKFSVDKDGGITAAGASSVTGGFTLVSGALSLPAGAVETADLAVAATVAVSTVAGTAAEGIDTTYERLDNLQLAPTVFSVNSVLVHIVQLKLVQLSGAGIKTASIRIHNTTAGTTVKEWTGFNVISASNAEVYPTLIVYQTSPISAEIYEVQGVITAGAIDTIGITADTHSYTIIEFKR